MGGVGGIEHGGPLRLDGFSPTVVDVGGGVEPYAGVAVLVVVTGEEPHAEGVGVLVAAEPAGELGPVLEGLCSALVLYNASDPDAKAPSGWRRTMEPIATVPQGLGSLAFNVLTATSVYLAFRQAPLEVRELPLKALLGLVALSPVGLRAQDPEIPPVVGPAL